MLNLTIFGDFGPAIKFVLLGVPLLGVAIWIQEYAIATPEPILEVPILLVTRSVEFFAVAISLVVFVVAYVASPVLVDGATETIHFVIFELSLMNLILEDETADTVDV